MITHDNRTGASKYFNETIKHNEMCRLVFNFAYIFSSFPIIFQAWENIVVNYSSLSNSKEKSNKQGNMISPHE